MTCEEAAMLMEAYLDSELDARGSAEVAVHLESCRECADAFAAARSGNTRVNEFLRAEPDEAGDSAELWRGIEHRLTAAARPRARLGRWFAVAAACVALAAGVWFFRGKGEQHSLIAALERDHREFLAGEFGPAFQGPPPPHILAAAAGRVDAAAFAALPEGADFTIEGSRLCHLDGVPVAWTLVRHRGQPVSWIALRHEELAHFPDLRRALDSGQPVVVTQAGPYHFAARVAGGYVVCALAELPREEMRMLVQAAPSR
ncbi:MAG: zf-HC2 domain-containing protein [Chthoniobacteraceae bacterium]